MAKRCPACHLAASDSEDYCPVDGRRLVADGPPSGLAAHTHPGLMRRINQDAVAAVATDRGAVLVVCDGISASPGSDVAAQAAAAVVASELVAYSGRAPADSDHAQAVRDAIQQAHRRLCEDPRGEPIPPGTTVVVALVIDQTLALGWVGDSRAYWVSPDRCEQLTHDHSWINEIVESGAMDLDEATRSPNAHAITRCVGPLEGSDETRPDSYALDLPQGGALVLCSDGLWNYTPTPHDLAAVAVGALDDADAVARVLIDHALDSGGFDNVSVAVQLLAAR